MSGVIGMADLLLLTDQTVQQREYTHVARECGRNLMRVLNDILDYSKIEAGKLELERTDFELPVHIESIVELLGPQFRAKGVNLTTQLGKELPTFVAGDPGRLRQVIINLAGNALKFTPPGGSVSIAVARARSDEGRETARFTIADTGIGISPADVERIFVPFSQADGSTSRTYGGTGLGLSISAQLVSLMDGSIGVESTPGTGSAFWFSIPLAAAKSAAKVQPTVPADLAPGSLTVRSEKILLAEDNEVNTFLARDQFRRLGFAIRTVVNGREAVEAVRREHFDLVFMDCHMPDMDGFEATSQIRDFEALNGARLPIVAMTADARVEDRDVCLTAGMDDYLSKPASIADLKTIVDRWLPAPGAA